ncbi:MAG: SLBB domain-containing protein, partial [Planctomycetota bacterium]
GAIQAPGMYALQSPDLRLLDALAIAGGIPLTTRSIFVIRQVNLSERMEPGYRRGETSTMPQPADDDVSIEELIQRLNNPDGDGAQPAIFRQEGQPPVDVDDLDPARQPPPVDVEPLQPPARPVGEETFIFDPQRGEWVPVTGPGVPAGVEGAVPDTMPLVTERVIRVPFQRLKRGDNSYNLVIRPGDRVYIEEAPQGVVYLEGEVFRPGVYNLPQGGRLTLSRLIAAAGGLGPLAIPERVDLTRVVADSREATVRLNLRAIRTRTEPDVVLKADDHVIVGTNFWATPLAVIRNGFRVTYGFGFLLDRNFGNDVFGAPPSNVGGG